MDDNYRIISITENHFSYVITNYENNVHIEAKSDIDKREWSINIQSDISGEELGIKSELIFKILEDYSKGVEDLKRYYMVEFPLVPKDKTGDLMIVIRSISFYNSEEKIYRILLKLKPKDNVERLEERIAELRNQQNHSEAIINVYRGIINEQDKRIKKLTENLSDLTHEFDDHSNNFRILSQLYGFKFNSDDSDDIAGRFSSPALPETDISSTSNESNENNNQSSKTDAYITNSISQQINLCMTRIEILETEITDAKSLYQNLIQLVNNTNESLNNNMDSIKSCVDDNNVTYRDNLTQINSTLIIHNDEISSMKSNIENTQKAGVYSKKHIERINERLTCISELINNKFADTSRRIKEDFLLSRSPTNSWGGELMNNHMNNK